MKALALLFTILSINSAQVLIGEFYEFGIAAADTTLERNDDAFSLIRIDFDFPFFGKLYEELYISTNGIFSFGAGISSFVPSPFPLIGMHVVAAYWTDSDPRKGSGNIFFRQVYDQSTLNRI